MFWIPLPSGPHWAWAPPPAGRPGRISPARGGKTRPGRPQGMSQAGGPTLRIKVFGLVGLSGGPFPAPQHRREV